MAEQEYIPREAAIDHVYDCCLESKSCNLNCIKDIPAADVVPVVHGRWAITADEWLQHCSICGQRRPIVAGDYKWNYCPNCGALMDKDGDGE